MEAHMTRFSSVQKLQAKTEHRKCILSHVVRSKFILKSCFSHALLNTYVSCSKNASEIREKTQMEAHIKLVGHILI